MRAGVNHTPAQNLSKGGLCVYDMKQLGKLCGKHRRKLKVKQQQVAIATGYSIKNISSFENGHCNNAKILLWYINNGLDKEQIRGCYYGKKA